MAKRKKPDRVLPPETPEPKRDQTILRSDAATIQSLRHFAAWHGRGLNQEIEVAVQTHLTRSMVDALNWPTFRDELERDRPDLDLDAFQAEQEAHLRDLEAYAVRRPPELDSIVELLP